MAAASEDESKQMSDHHVTSSDLLKTEDNQAQAPVSSMSGGRLVTENPFLIWFLVEDTEMNVFLFKERHVSIQTSLEGLEMLVDLNGGNDLKYWK